LPILLSLPAIVGTAFFLAGVILTRLNLNPAPADFDPWRESTNVQDFSVAASSALYFAIYFGAAFGPLLLPLAGYEAFNITRATGLRSRVAIWVWTFVVLGLIATSLFWGWLSTLDIFV